MNPEERKIADNADNADNADTAGVNAAAGGGRMVRKGPDNRRIALYGMLIALAFVFSYIEFLIPINLGVPGVKLGLANLVNVAALYTMGPASAAVISIIRVVLNGLTFGNLSMMLYSLAGAFLSIIVMSVLKKLDILSITGVSIAGGAAHNIGQLLVAAAVLETSSIFYYLPVLLIAGTIAGTLIGIVGAIITKRLSSFRIS